MSNVKNIAVFASGNGSNFQSLVEAEETGKLNGHIAIVISDKPKAFVINRANNLNVPVFYFDPKQYDAKKDYEEVITEVLREFKIELIVLAGYMRLIGNTLLKEYPNKIINLHPSLLPAFPGKAAIEQAFTYGARVTGATVHFVDEGMDTGPIIQQKVISIEQGESIEQLTDKIHQIEHELLIESVNLILSEQYKLENRKVIITK